MIQLINRKHVFPPYRTKNNPTSRVYLDIGERDNYDHGLQSDRESVQES